MSKSEIINKTQMTSINFNAVYIPIGQIQVEGNSY